MPEQQGGRLLAATINDEADDFPLISNGSVRALMFSQLLKFKMRNNNN